MVELIGHPLVILAVVWISVYLILRFVLKWSPRGVKLYPLGFILKSERALPIFDKIASAIPSLIKVLSDLGIAMGFGMMSFAIYILTKNLGTYLFAPAAVGPQNIVIPLVIGVTIRFEHLPYMLLALGIVLITHEGMHGLIARLEGLRLKSTGLFLFYVFPGGFVEPDEEEFMRAPSRTRARVAAGGSFANLMVGLLAVFLMLSMFSPVEAGVVVTGTVSGSRLMENDVIFGVNGIPVNRTTLAQNISASQVLVVKTSRGDLIYELEKPLNMPLSQILRELGVTHIAYYFPMKLRLGDPLLEYNIYRLFFWIQLLGLNVAIFNMLPIHFLDGSLLVNALLERIIRSKMILKGLNLALTAFSISLIALNIGFTLKTFGLLQL